MKSEPKNFTLDQCVEIAVKNNYDVLIANAQVETSGADITNAFGRYLPSINFSGGYSRQLNVKGGNTVDVGGQIIPIPAPNPNSYSMNAYASYLLFDGFSRGANYSRAQESYNSNYNNSLYVIKRVKRDVNRQFFDIIKKFEIVKIRQENLELGRKVLEMIQAQEKAGTIPITNVYAQEADLGNSEYELVVAENDLNVAKAQLLYTMGLNTDYDAEFLESSINSKISEDDIVKFRSDIGSQDAAVSEALKNRLDYTSLQSGLEAANSNVAISRSGYYPSISANGGWSWANSSLDQFSDFGRSYLGLSVSLPIFDNFNTNYRIQTAELQVKQIEIQKQQLEQNIRTNIQTAFMNLDAAEKQLDISNRALKSAQESYDSFNERFKVGASGITDYLTANNQLITAQINRINAVYGYLLAQKEILFAIGKF